VGVLADAFTDTGYALTAVEVVADQVGVLVAEQAAVGGRTRRAPVSDEDDLTNTCRRGHRPSPGSAFHRHVETTLGI